MKIILLGYGKMGHEVEQIALQRGHEIVARIDKDKDSETQRLRDLVTQNTKSSLVRVRRCFCLSAT